VDSRIKALACWGTLYDRKDLANRKAIYTVPAMAMSGTKTIEDATKFYEFMDLTGHVQNIKCPVFLTHGGLDIIPLEHAYRFLKELPSEAETMIWDDAIHCCHDRSHIVRPGMADFFLQNL
jgi:2,6-dihydroxypseudooxynicotine hydrolase